MVSHILEKGQKWVLSATRCSDRIITKACLTAALLVLGYPAQGLLADVTITQLANEGVILSDGHSASVMIDGMVTDPYSVYGGLSGEALDQFFQAEGPFGDVGLAVASHQHHDHNQPSSACQYLQTSTDTVFVSSAQVIDLMREKCRQFVTTSPRIRIINPQYGQNEVIEQGGIKVTVFLLSHGVGKYASLQNFAHLVEIGGMRVLHVGDAATEREDFVRADVASMKVDIALIPFWYFRPGPAGDGGTVNDFLSAPHQIAVHIPPGEMQEVKEYLNAEFPHVLILENPLEQVQFSSTSATPPPPP